MPSSSDVDDTTHLISPLLSLSSTSRRISLPRELWCTSMFSRPRSFSLYTTLSAPDLVFVNTSVVSCWSMSSFRVSYIIEFTMSDDSVVMSSVGQITFRSSCFLEPDSMRATSRMLPSGSHPTRYPAMASIGARVADNPILTKSFLQWCLRRSSVSERKAPLLESQMSWISSMITHSTRSKASLNLGAARMRARLSGVVIRM